MTLFVAEFYSWLMDSFITVLSSAMSYSEHSVVVVLVQVLKVLICCVELMIALGGVRVSYSFVCSMQVV